MFKSQVLVLFAVLANSLVSSTQLQGDNIGVFQSDWPVGDPRRCQEQSRLSKLDVKRFEVVTLSPVTLSPVTLSPVTLSTVTLSPVKLSRVTLSPVTLSPVTLSISSDTIPSDTISSDTIPSYTITSDTISSETIPSDTITSETIPRETIPSDTIPSDTIPSDTITSETIPSYTITSDTISSETIPSDTITSETIPRETIPRDTIPSDTIPSDTIPSDTITSETITCETIPRETIPRDTIPSDTIPSDTISSDTITSDAITSDAITSDMSSNFVLFSLNVLPGVGWDNLRNLEAGLVVTYNFTQCKVTDDGNLLIPDNVFTVPVKSSRVERFAELIDQWHNSSSLTANTINVDAGMSLGIFSISGTYSSEHQELKSKQIENKATTVRVQMRYKRYEAKLQPDPVLSPQFKSRLLSIAARIVLNQTEQARYEGQLLVRDFGTHVLTSVTAGAALIKDDYLKSRFIQDNSESKASILATASASFLKIFHFNANYSHSTDNTLSNSYTNSLTHSLVKTLGGPIIQPENISIDAWAKGIDQNLIPLDRAGDPLYFMVTAQTLPELPPSIVIEVEQVVRLSIELYYEMNTIRGCTQLGSPKFSFSANFDDGSCTGRSTNVTFG
ncbi:Macrophage-expressed protein 1 protein, partial [Bulinus truncatus]